MTITEARKVQREPVKVSNTYRFFSDCVECKSDNEVLIRSYSGQWAYVIEWINQAECEAEALAAALWIGNNPGGEWEWQNMPLYKVRANNGDTFDANESELNGWIFDTGQWVGPRIC